MSTASLKRIRVKCYHFDFQTMSAGIWEFVSGVCIRVEAWVIVNSDSPDDWMPLILGRSFLH